ncbi:hypothetical protein BSKO_02982 [Bryopsis sp. KO-2023]|nr:hypothetical protein BSKO_02982 [Bryopsis sp. KO-2023]
MAGAIQLMFNLTPLRLKCMGGVENGSYKGALLEKCEKRGEAVGNIVVKNACRELIEDCDPGAPVPKGVPQNLVKKSLYGVWAEVDRTMDANGGKYEKPLVKDICGALHKMRCIIAITDRLLLGDVDDNLQHCRDLVNGNAIGKNCNDLEMMDLAGEWSVVGDKICDGI